MDEVVGLTVNGVSYRGWKSMRVTRSLDSISGSFEVSVSDQSQHHEWPIQEGDACILKIDDHPLVTGYVDVRRVSFAAGSHDVTVAGRDRTADLVDCSAGWTVDASGAVVALPREFRQVAVLEFIRRLTKPFQIPVVLQASLHEPTIDGQAAAAPRSRREDTPALTQPLRTLSVDPGDSLFDVINRICEQVGLFAMTDGHGNLVLTRASVYSLSPTGLAEGLNILSASATFDGSRCYRHYQVTGQQSGDDFIYGEAAASVTGSAVDLGARAGRVLEVRHNGNLTPALATRIAQWESTVRAARAAEVTVTVQGWYQAKNQLWAVNTLVPVRSARLGIDSAMLIRETSFRLDQDGGSTTELALVRHDAFTPVPLLPEKPTKKTAIPLELDQ